MTVRPLDEHAIFEGARHAQSAELRNAYLDQQCGNDAELRNRIEALLRAYDEGANFLESPPPEVGAFAFGAIDSRTIDRSIAEGPGTVIGPYKLLQQIGEGGMGVVFMAEQTEPIQRTVALKIIKPGMDTHQVIARFEAERQAVAMMDHPNIARVLDAGTTDTGRPYFVMDLVKGVPITDYCDQQHLTVRKRLELFTQVCHAVQHAHQKGIIHRDIKPTNGLVAEYDGKPVPKIIDFGVAKATAQRLTERTVFTEFGQLIGTFEYMSPEQARFNQLDIDTRSDIYSLGVLLYELLVGSTPLEKERLRAAAFNEILRFISDEEPPRPSRRLSSSQALPSISAQRQIEPAKLAKLVRGELDWIVMKCLEKNRNRRYETANSLASDIERYLNNEPVHACPPSAIYGFRKFARRNFVALAAGAFVILALVLGTVVSTWQAIVATRAREEATAAREEATAAQTAAEANFQKALGAVDAMLTQVSEESLGEIPQMELVRRTLLEKALTFYQDFLHEKSTDPGVRLETALAYRRVHDIYNILIQMPQARQACLQSIAILEELEAQFPDVHEYTKETAQSYHQLGVTLAGMRAQVEPKAPERAFRQAIRRNERLVADFSDQPRYGYELIENYARLAQQLRLDGNYGEAESVYHKGIELHTQLAKRSKPTSDDRNTFSNLYGGLAGVFQDTGRVDEAEQQFRAMLEMKRKLVADFPTITAYRRYLAVGYYRFGKLLQARQKIPEAEAAFREAATLQERISAEHLHLVFYHMELIETLEDLRKLLQQSGKPEEAKAQMARMVAMYGPVIEHRERQAHEFPKERDYHIWLIGSHQRLGGLYRDLGQFDNAVASYRNAITARKTYGTQFDIGPIGSGVIFGHVRVADVLKAANRHDEAVREYVEAAKLLKDAYSKPVTNANVVSGCKLVIDSLNESLKQRDPDSFDWFSLSMLHRLIGNNDEAKKSFDQAVQWMEKNRPDDEELRDLRAIAAQLLGVIEKPPSPGSSRPNSDNAIRTTNN